MIKHCMKNVAHLCSNSEVSPLFLPYFKQSCVIADWIQAVSHITHSSHSSGKTLIDLQFVLHPEVFERTGCADVLPEQWPLNDLWCALQEGRSDWPKIEVLAIDPSRNAMYVEELVSDLERICHGVWWTFLIPLTTSGNTCQSFGLLLISMHLWGRSEWENAQVHG